MFVLARMNHKRSVCDVSERQARRNHRFRHAPVGVGLETGQVAQMAGEDGTAQLTGARQSQMLACCQTGDVLTVFHRRLAVRMLVNV